MDDNKKVDMIAEQFKEQYPELYEFGQATYNQGADDAFIGMSAGAAIACTLATIVQLIVRLRKHRT